MSAPRLGSKSVVVLLAHAGHKNTEISRQISSGHPYRSWFSCTHPATPSRAAFLQDESHRIRFIYTPKHCSWLNQVVAGLVFCRAVCSNEDSLSQPINLKNAFWSLLRFSTKRWLNLFVGLILANHWSRDTPCVFSVWCTSVMITIITGDSTQTCYYSGISRILTFCRRCASVHFMQVF